MKMCKKLSASGQLLPDPHEALCPWTPLGAMPVYARAPHSPWSILLRQILDLPLRVLHSSNEPGELLQGYCHKTVLGINSNDMYGPYNKYCINATYVPAHISFGTHTHAHNLITEAR